MEVTKKPEAINVDLNRSLSFMIMSVLQTIFAIFGHESSSFHHASCFLILDIYNIYQIICNSLVLKILNFDTGFVGLEDRD